MEDNFHTDLRTSYAQFLEKKAASKDRKTPKIKFCHKKSTCTKFKIIEIIFQFCLPACRLQVHMHTYCTACLGKNKDN